jgi:hypothetical protein
MKSISRRAYVPRGLRALSVSDVLRPCRFDSATGFDGESISPKTPRVNDNARARPRFAVGCVYGDRSVSRATAQFLFVVILGLHRFVSVV